jgi:predicted metal-dependent phosphoesterase TrpH
MSETPAPRFVDLQTHSTASDGALPPAAVVEAAKAAGLSAVALTDHDTVDGLPEAISAGERVGVRVVPGVELSTHLGTDEIHLLGLHLLRLEVMDDALARLREQRVRRAERIVATLNGHGIPVTVDAVLAEAGDGAVGRPHIARVLMAGGWVHDFREAFDKWLGWGRPAYVEKERFEVGEAIALVHAASGLAVWAHPGEDGTPTRIGRLTALGLDGIEVLHPSHPPYLSERLFGYAESAGLLPSGGSDWHGAADGHRRLGGQLVPMIWLDQQDAAVTRRRAAAG